MGQQSQMDAISRYLEDAAAAEKNFEDQLRAFANDSVYEEARQLFLQHAEETRAHHDRLAARLEALGAAPSGVKSFVAHLFGFAPRTAQMGHDPAEKTTQDLVMAFAAENSQIAMYEALAVAAAAAGDTVTEGLAREIQSEERVAAQKVWDLVAPCARDSFEKVTRADTAGARRAA